MNKTTEIWKTTTAKGAERYWKYGYRAGRALPVKRADAEHGLMTGTHILTTKPEWVGK
jgi:hypothetical protein